MCLSSLDTGAPLLNLFSYSDWLARLFSLQMFTDWIMELSRLLLNPTFAFPQRIISS